MGKSKRIYFLDNLKIVLIFLVIIHHVGQPYGPPGGFWPMVSGQPDTLPWLGSFFTVNASFFMGLFFMISGYFFAPSWRKKGTSLYLKDKFLRYGIPLLIVYILIMPLCLYFYYSHFSGNPLISFGQYYRVIYWGIEGQPDWFKPSIGFPESSFGFGHMWFVDHLLIYAILYAIIRSLFGESIKIPALLSKPVVIIPLIVIFISFFSIVIRQDYPIDRWTNIGGFFQTELAHLPQYFFLLIIGVVAQSINLFDRISTLSGKLLLFTGIIMALLIYFSPILPKLGNKLIWSNFEIFESILCICLCFGLIVIFREYFNTTSGFTRLFSSNAYGAYIFHFPIVMAVQYLFNSVEINLLSKFIIVSVLSIFLSFLFTLLLRKITLVRRVI